MWCQSCVATTAASPPSTESRGRLAGLHRAESGPPVTHGGGIEIAGAPQRFLAQEIVDESRLRIHVEAIERRAKNDLAGG